MDNKEWWTILEVFLYSNIFLWIAFWLLRWTSQKSKGITPNTKLDIPKINPKEMFLKKIAKSDAIKEYEATRETLG